MRDWKNFVTERLAGLIAPPEVKEDVTAELAAHLEECYSQARCEGLDDDAAFELALREVDDWPALSDSICRAKENAMNHRTKTVWLPGIAALFAVGLVLLFLDRAALMQRLIWLACMAMLFGAASSETNRLNQRTRSFWLPGFGSLTAACLLLLALDTLYTPWRLFLEISLHPQDLLRLNSGSPHFLYFGWLLAQVVFGALGALFSRRAGGTRIARIVAGAFPAVVIVGTYVALMPFTVMFSGKATTASLRAYAVSAMLVWVVAPGLTLLLGAAPFLREPSDRPMQPC